MADKRMGPSHSGTGSPSAKAGCRPSCCTAQIPGHCRASPSLKSLPSSRSSRPAAIHHGLLQLGSRASNFPVRMVVSQNSHIGASFLMLLCVTSALSGRCGVCARQNTQYRPATAGRDPHQCTAEADAVRLVDKVDLIFPLPDRAPPSVRCPPAQRGVGPIDIGGKSIVIRHRRIPAPAAQG